MGFRKNYCIYLEEDVHDEFVRKYIEGKGVSLSFMVNKILKEYLNNNKKEVNQNGRNQ